MALISIKEKCITEQQPRCVRWTHISAGMQIPGSDSELVVFLGRVFFLLLIDCDLHNGRECDAQMSI